MPIFVFRPAFLLIAEYKFVNDTPLEIQCVCEKFGVLFTKPKSQLVGYR